MSQVTEQTAVQPVVYADNKTPVGKRLGKRITELVAVFLTLVIFVIPLYFVFVNAAKSTQESAVLTMHFPKSFQLFANINEVLSADNGVVIRAFVNSILITAFSIIILILVGAMAGYVLQRKVSKASG